VSNSPSDPNPDKPVPESADAPLKRPRFSRYGRRGWRGGHRRHAGATCICADAINWDREVDVVVIGWPAQAVWWRESRRGEMVRPC